MKRATFQSPVGNSKPKPSPTSRRNAHKSSKENLAPPPDNVPSSPAAAAKVKSPFPPRHPSSNPLKRKLEPVPETTSSSVSSTSPESGVQVIVRMRPLNKDEEEGGMIAQKISDDCLSISGHAFTFDSIADPNSTQQDIFQLVGSPLVENCLSGFNSSVFAYGQTGSGKTYTMWGPANALSEKNMYSDQQGLTPRVFQRLFARINEEQRKHADKQLKYQCRCSFLEIYNEQITDLLDPSQKNLQIREDVKSGVYVKNLREEYVLTMKDVMKLLAKGFSQRRTGATSINAESSRSHSVFTCIVESRCKSNADGISSLKTSRINLVDLAGSERQKLTGAAGDRLKEAVNINRSLSQLGNLINVLAEVSQTGKQRHIPYRDSRLTFLLQESLGGNAKLAMVCAVSPSLSCKNETFSTLRFAQRAKAIKNKAVVNEEMEDDVNHLREIIRQLRDDLHRAKDNGNKATGWNPRKSMILLKSLIDPQTRFVDEDGDEEMEIDEEAVERLCDEVGAAAVALDSGRHVAMHDRIIESSELSVAPSEISLALKSPTPSRGSSLALSLSTASQRISKDGDALAVMTSSFSFNKPTESMPNFLFEKADVGVQTFPGEDEMIQKNADTFVCVDCKKKRARIELKDVDECSNTELLVPNAIENDLAGGSLKEIASEKICAKQALEIMQLNRLVQQYRYEKEELLEEIQGLRSQLDHQNDSSSSAQKRVPLLDMIPESTEGGDEVELEDDPRIIYSGIRESTNDSDVVTPEDDPRSIF